MKRFIQTNKSCPFFCYAPWTPPHARYGMPTDDPAWQAVKDKPWQLYDLSNDLAERRNMADNHPDLVKRLDVWVTANRTDPRGQKEPPTPKSKRYRQLRLQQCEQARLLKDCVFSAKHAVAFCE